MDAKSESRVGARAERRMKSALHTRRRGRRSRSFEGARPAASERLRPPLSGPAASAGSCLIYACFGGRTHRRLVEPFCGGLAVALGLMPERALLNDINQHLINFYEWLKRGLLTKLRMENEASFYYQNRDRFNRLLRSPNWNSRKAAALFYYLNRTGYNGLCRFNSKGEFNVPFGRHSRITYAEDFLKYQAAFSTFEFTNHDFTKIQLKTDDFIYADPPYDVQFTDYSKDGFTWNDQERAAEWLAHHSGPVVLSNQATTRILRLYRSLDYKVRIVPAPRLINCTGDRSPAQEVLATRNIPTPSRS